MSALIRQSHANNQQSLWLPADAPSQLFQYALPSGTPGGAGIAQTYQTRPINQGIPSLDVNGFSIAIPGCRLLNNEIILPAGTYSISASVVGLMTAQKARIFDVTNNVVLAIGLSVGAESRNNESSVMCEATFFGSTTIAIQFWGVQAFGNQDWGQAVGAGDDEIYLQCLITKQI
jgi:hypothetical protein